MGLEQIEIVHNRTRRHMARILEHFEAEILPLIPSGHERIVKDHKAKVRSELGELRDDAIDFLNLSGETQNVHATELRQELGARGAR